MPNQNLMTEDEIHDFGIQIVLDDLRKNGFQIVSVMYDRISNPQITAKRNGFLFHILTRTACYPQKGKLENSEVGFKALQEARAQSAKCFFASIGIANSQGTTDLEMSIPIRGAGFYVAYEGIKELTPQMINLMRLEPPHKVYNQNGDIGGSVTRQPDGRHIINIGNKGDASSLMMSLGMVFASDFADGLNKKQQIIFSRWAHLSETVWTEAHKELFTIALMHYFMEVKVRGGNLPSEVVMAINSLPPRALPDLPYSLTNEIRSIFSSLF